MLDLPTRRTRWPCHLLHRQQQTITLLFLSDVGHDATRGHIFIFHIIAVSSFLFFSLEFDSLLLTDNSPQIARHTSLYRIIVVIFLPLIPLLSLSLSRTNGGGAICYCHFSISSSTDRHLTDKYWHTIGERMTFLLLLLLVAKSVFTTIRHHCPTTNSAAAAAGVPFEQ